MAYEVVMPYHLHMPSYFLETFTEYPFLLIGARFARPKTACLVYYSQGSDRWFGQANPAPTVNNLTDHFTFGIPLIFITSI